jgi:hypothetical protein
MPGRSEEKLAANYWSQKLTTDTRIFKPTVQCVRLKQQREAAQIESCQVVNHRGIAFAG